MELSKHNITGKIKGSDDYYIINPLSGSADLLTKEELQSVADLSFSDTNLMLQRGYWVEPAEEEKLYRQKYLDFIDEREDDEVQLFFVPWYACNFSCSYCFQDEYGYDSQLPAVSADVIDAFFSMIDNKFAGKKKYITVFGGEPLLGSQKYKEIIKKLLDDAKARSLDVAIVTNGYLIDVYIDILKDAPIREIQVTLDGDQGMHDKRRVLKGKGETFDKIAKNISLLLDNEIPVNLRMVVDVENVGSLPALAQFAIDKGWTKSAFFKTQLGRNYELHHCQEDNKRLFTRLSMYEAVYEIIKKYPHVLEFHKPAFSIAKFLFENGELPSPLFDSCPACKTEWAFDFTGKIYSCTATVGKGGEELGAFFPKLQIDEDAVEEWEERDVLSIEKCGTCNLRLACGGGCGSVAKNWNGGIQQPDCRPVDELLSLGVALYNS